MGIRITKVIGYGLRLSENDDRILNFDYQCKTLGNFEDWVLQNYEECKSVYRKISNFPFNSWIPLKKQYRKIHIRDMILSNMDDPDASAVVIINPQLNITEASRYDNLIDYYESGGILENKILDLYGIFPYSTVELKPGVVPPEFITNDKMRLWLFENMDSNNFYQLLSDTPQFSDQETVDFFKNSFRPLIPMWVVILAYYTNLLKDFDKTMHDFRPMIFTFWS